MWQIHCFEGSVSKKLDRIGSGVKIKDKFSHHAKILFYILKKLLVSNKWMSTTGGKQGNKY